MLKTLSRTLVLTSLLFSQYAMAERVKVAFIADQGTLASAQAVLALIAAEGTDLLMIQGDLGYQSGRVAEWDANITNALGRNFPVLTVIGNHEDEEWGEYKQLIKQRINRAGDLSCSGEVGEKAVCRFKGIEVVQASPGITNVPGINPDDDFAGFIESSFENSNSRWRICSWHMNQAALQTGQKSDATGWGVYEACLNAGAFVAVGHEHAYSRTHLLSDFENQTIVHTNNDMTIQPGQSFMFVSGLGGWDVREQLRGGDWWASVYTATQNATSGALFCTFEDSTADCYFKAIDGSVPDQFRVRLPNGTSAAAPTPVSPPPPAPSPVAVAPPASASVPTPTNLTVQVYSSTSIEVFWDRVNNQSLQYEVSVNGELIRTTDGTSAYLDGLSRGQQMSINVVAINTAGDRSNAASTSVNTSGDSNDADPTPVTPVTPAAPVIANAPAAPRNAYVDVYSSSTIEVFWDRYTAAILTYEVSVDGEVVAITDGTSSYIQDLSAGQHAVGIVALDSNGNRSNPTSISVTASTGDAPTSTPAPLPVSEPTASGSLDTPANLTAQVYSSSAIEVFWDRPANAQLSYVVFVNGEVASTTSGVSLFIDGLQRGARYDVDVQAVALDGQRSSLATILVTTRP